MPKGEKLIGPMQKDRTTTTTLFSKNFFKKEGENIQTIKTLSTAKGRTPSGGDFLFNQRKSIWNMGRIFKILKLLLEIILLYHCLFAKEFEKTFPKDLKNKLSGANVVQNVKLDQSNHEYLKILSIGSIQSNLCTYDKLQTGYISTMCIYFGLCWHQSPKMGRLKGKCPQHFL
jgi:hypothetical protein